MAKMYARVDIYAYMYIYPYTMTVLTIVILKHMGSDE